MVHPVHQGLAALSIPARSAILLIGGRSGVGKTTVGSEIHAQLSAASVRHCLIEGDNLDLAYPPPHEHHLAERNLAAMWANYRALGYRRMIYTNTASVLATEIRKLVAATGDDPHVTAALLTCSDQTAHERLARREIGTGLDRHAERSTLMARKLAEHSPDTVHRIATDGRPIAELAAEIIRLSAWNHSAKAH